METTAVSLKDRIDALFLGWIDKAAGIDEDNIGIICFIREFVAMSSGITEEDFGINQILGTAKANQSYFTGFWSLSRAHRLEIIGWKRKKGWRYS